MHGAKMTLAKHNKLFLCITCMIFSLGLPANAADRQVAMFPFWGENQEMAGIIWNELFIAMTEKEGFTPVRINMANLPHGVPAGGFPPSINPGPSLMGGLPFAITGNVFFNPPSEQWHLRLYLWHSTDIRPLISDELIAADQETIRVIIPFMLEWLFSWAPPPPEPIATAPPLPLPATAPQPPEPAATPQPPEPEMPPPEPVTEPQPPEPVAAPPPEPEMPPSDNTRTVIHGEHYVIVHYGTMRTPHNWLYVGLRAGTNLQMFNPLWSSDSFDGIHRDNLSVAAYLNIQPFRFFGFLFLGFQTECILMWDAEHDNTWSMTVPVLARFTARTGSMSFLLLGGPYLLFPVAGNDTVFTFGHATERIRWGHTVGLGVGNRIGPGSFNLELRLSNDMFSIRRADTFYNRRMISFSIGYEIGFFGR